MGQGAVTRRWRKVSGPVSPPATSEYWSRYYEVTADRPAWATVRIAIASFAAHDERRRKPRFAVDLGCGAGRDTRELLRAGWRVLAVDREPAGLGVLLSKAAGEGLDRLQTEIADLAHVVVPPCDLVNANLSLPFLQADDFWATWRGALAAIGPGGRISAMLFGDRDASAADADMTCPAPELIRASLTGFAVEHWVDLEEDSPTALGEPHHFHRVEVVARRTAGRAAPRR